MEKVTVNSLIEVLNEVKAELGGNCEVRLYNGSDYNNPNEAEHDGYASQLIDVVVQGSKSFMKNKSRQLQTEEITVWFKYE